MGVTAAPRVQVSDCAASSESVSLQHRFASYRKGQELSFRAFACHCQRRCVGVVCTARVVSAGGEPYLILFWKEWRMAACLELCNKLRTEIKRENTLWSSQTDSNGDSKIAKTTVRVIFTSFIQFQFRFFTICMNNTFCRCRWELS